MVTFSPEATAELGRRVAECGEPNPGVVVGWLPAQRDLLRSAEGNAVWTEVEPNKWAVLVASLDDFPGAEERTLRIGGLHVYFAPGRSGVSHATVTYTDGKFHVR